MLEKGLEYTSSVVVDQSNVAEAMGSGDLPVFATPAMIALMENAAMRAVAGQLDEGTTTVGTLMTVSHVRATPIGEEVQAKALLEMIDGRKLTFKVIASDGIGVIGEGTHERFLVDSVKFMNKISRT